MNRLKQIRALLFSITCLFVIRAEATENCSTSEIYEKEFDAISNSAKGASNSTFLIYALDGFFTVPTRYVAYEPVGKGISITLGSGGYPINGISYLGCQAHFLPEGIISVGQRDSCKECDITDNSSASGYELLGTKSFKGVVEKQLLIQVPGHPGQRREIGLLYNENEFIVVSDENPRLWKVIFENYFDHGYPRKIGK